MRRVMITPDGPGPAWRDASAGAGFAAWHCDLARGDLLRWSPGVFGMFGLAPGEPLDRRDVVALYDPASRARLERLRAQAIAAGTGFALDARIVRPDGDERWIRIVAEAILRDGRSVALAGVKRDITAQVARGGHPLAG